MPMLASGPGTDGREAHGDRSGGVDIVFIFSYVSWQAAGERGWFMPEDRLAHMLPTNERVNHLLVCDPLRSLPVKLIRDCMTRDRVAFPYGERAQLLKPLDFRRRYPTSRTGVERRVAAYERALLRGVRRMDLRDPVVITANPLIAGFAGFSWARAVTFYAIDDWSAYPPHRRWWPAYRESFARITSSGRRVVAVSEAVLERIAPTGPCRVIPNGIEPGEWTGSPTPPNWMHELSRPLLVYAGTLDSRLDVAALTAIARARPEATLLLVGPLLDSDHLTPLRHQGNIEIRPSLGRRELAGLIRSADAGLITHVRSPLTEAMSPLKLYEYLAAGLPVLAADLPPMRTVAPSRVILVEEGGDYAAAARDVVALGRTGEQERLAFLEQNSWAARHEQLLDLALA
jgi:teichuronic acid biosynthesis glycosyltransferase TuaH